VIIGVKEKKERKRNLLKKDRKGRVAKRQDA